MLRPLTISESTKMKTLGDKREEYYEACVRDHKQYREFHSASVNLLFDFLYAYDVLEGQLAQRIASFGLSLSAFNVLMILRRYGVKGCPLSEIGELLLVSRANITGVMDSLESAGLVLRSPDANDRRVKIAHITPSGEQLLERILPDHYRYVRRSLSGLSAPEKTELARLLKKMRYSVQRCKQ
jgi:DNA-binding MarR family transcriptional regulator